MAGIERKRYMKTALLRAFRKACMICTLLAVIVLTAGCDKFTFDITTTGTNSKIKINKADDGDYAETNWFSIGKGRVAVIESSLDEGELQIDFAEVVISIHEDSSDEVFVDHIEESVTVKPGEKKEIPLEPGDYILQLTAIGTTNGTVTVNIEKP